MTPSQAAPANETSGHSPAELRQLVADIDRADDPRQAVLLVRARIAELDNQGSAIPAELAQMEKRLIAECIDASQCR